MKNNGAQPALFAPGDMTVTPDALTAMRKAGTTGLSLIYRHIRGDFGFVDERQRAVNDSVVKGASEEDIVSRYKFAGDIEIVLITSYAHTPSLRWTEIVLPEEVIPHEEYRGKQDTRDEDDTELEPLDEVFMVLSEMEPDKPKDESMVEEQKGTKTMGTTKQNPNEQTIVPIEANQEETTIQEPEAMPLDSDTAALVQFRRGPYQNRTWFDRVKMGDLAQAISSEGLIHPPIVFRQDDNTLALLGGERRWRVLCALYLAAQGQMSLNEALDLVCQVDAPTVLVEQWGHILKDKDIPIRLDTSGQAERQHRLSVIDNAQHVGLNPIEEGLDYQSLKTAYGYSNRQVARAIGKSEGHITGRLLWLELEAEIQELVAKEDLPRDPRVATALLTLPDPKTRLKAAQYHAGQKSSIRVIVGACEKLNQKLRQASSGEGSDTENGLGQADTPMLGLVAKQGHNGQLHTKNGDIRQAAQTMCHKCSIGQSYRPEFPEPAWAVIKAEATYICDGCKLRPVMGTCENCPGVILLRSIVEPKDEKEMEAVTNG